MFKTLIPTALQSSLYLIHIFATFCTKELTLQTIASLSLILSLSLLFLDENVINFLANTFKIILAFC